MDIITKNAEYDISKKLFDFEAYASKKHAIYPDLYSLAFELWDELSSFAYKFGIKIELRRAGFDELGLDNDVLKSSFQTEMEPITDKINEAYNYFYKNELYLSKDTATAYTETLESLRKLVYEIEYRFHTYSTGTDWQNHSVFQYIVAEEITKKCEEKINILKETIYKELSYTHFEEV